LEISTTFFLVSNRQIDRIMNGQDTYSSYSTT